jgi:hypothetical protein
MYIVVTVESRDTLDGLIAPTNSVYKCYILLVYGTAVPVHTYSIKLLKEDSARNLNETLCLRTKLWPNLQKL